MKRMITRDEFVSLYFKKLPKVNTYEQAYELAEEDVISEYKCRKYKNYESFKHVLRFSVNKKGK